MDNRAIGLLEVYGLVCAFIAEAIILHISSLVIVSFGLNLPSEPLIIPAS